MSVMWLADFGVAFDGNSAAYNNKEAARGNILRVAIHVAGEGPEDLVKLEAKAPILHEGTVRNTSGAADLRISNRSTSGVSAAGTPAARIIL